MSLKSGPIHPVPEETIRVARAAFPNGNLRLGLRDKLGPIFEDKDFAQLLPKDGQRSQRRGVTSMWWTLELEITASRNSLKIGYF